MILFSFCLCGLLWLLPQLSTVSNAQSLCPDVTECYCFTSGYDIRADCIGEDITVVSTDLPWNMTQLYISYSSMGTLLSGNLSMYEELTLVELVENHLLTTIQTGAFNGLDFITSLVILHNAIESIPLDTLPKMLQTIYLQNNELNAMPPLNGLTEVQLINLDYNKIIEIEGNAFSTNSKLEEIYLSNNNIQSIATGAFNNLNNLRTLYLNGNQIPSIEVGDFNGLSQLQTLSFMDNKLTELINGAFNGIGTTTLTELNLSSNQITSIEGDVFSSFSSLKALHLVNNRLTTVPSEAIKGPTMLQFLDLSFNRLETIEDNSFAGMNNLDTLNIGEMNSLLTISENAFVGMPKILIFTLHGNKNLTELNLGYLPDNEFQQLQQLRIYNNGFITLQEDTFATKASLQRVELFDNPFHCDCKLGWMPRVIEEDVVWAREWVGGNQILCQTPKHLEAFNIPTMKVKDFVCDLPAVEPSYSGGQDKVVAYLHGNATLKAVGSNGIPMTWWKSPSGEEYTPLRTVPTDIQLVENVSDLNTSIYKANWGFTSCSTATVTLGQVLSIVTCGSRTHIEDIAAFETYEKSVDETLVIATLEFKNATLSDAGVYKVWVSNHIGNVSADIELEVLPYELTPAPLPTTPEIDMGNRVTSGHLLLVGLLVAALCTYII